MIEKPKRLTQKWRIETARGIIDRNQIGVQFCSEDLADFLDVCQFEADGVKRMKNPQFRSDPRHIHALVGNDWESFSWKNAIQKPEPTQKIKRVMRHAIREDLDDFRSSAEPYECWSCGSTEDITVDHVAPPFDEIANTFFKTYGVPEIMPSNNQDVVVDMFCNESEEAAWITWHAGNACYQLLCRSCNASKGKR